MHYWNTYYYIQPDKKMQHLKENVYDIFLLLIYTGISYFTAITNIEKMRYVKIYDKSIYISMIFLFISNLVILLRKHLKLRCKINIYKKDVKLKMETTGKAAQNVVINAWQHKCILLYIGYISIVLVMLVIKVAGNQTFHPINIIALIVSSIIFIIDISDNIEDIRGVDSYSLLSTRKKVIKVEIALLIFFVTVIVFFAVTEHQDNKKFKDELLEQNKRIVIVNYDDIDLSKECFKPESFLLLNNDGKSLCDVEKIEYISYSDKDDYFIQIQE